MQAFQDTVGWRLGSQETAWGPTYRGDEDLAAEPARPADQGTESTVEEHKPQPSNPLLGIRSASGGEVVTMASIATEQAGTASESDDKPPSSPRPPTAYLHLPASRRVGSRTGQSSDDIPRAPNSPTRGATGMIPAAMLPRPPRTISVPLWLL